MSLLVLRLLIRIKKTYIGQLEAMAADACIHTLPADRLQNRKAFMWIDNISAKYSLQKGYSKVSDTGKVVNSFKVMQAKRQLRVWFEYVPSEQNIADLPSRRKWRELYEVIDAVSDGSWVCFRYDVVIPPYDSWLNHSPSSTGLNAQQNPRAPVPCHLSVVEVPIRSVKYTRT